MNTALGRIQKDIVEVNSQQNSDNPPIYAKPHEDSLEHVDALVIGPPGTPYEFGFYNFDMRFPQTYPNEPPKVLITTTNHGQTRFNPNLYAGGKVCLSILGTWSGEAEDEWRSSYSVQYILCAIQSLIMTSTPYHNEPGYEKVDSHYSKPEEVGNYSEKISHENLRVAVCQQLESCLSAEDNNPFREIIKNHFLMWYEIYVRRATEKEKENHEFPMMPFEYPENQAAGKYDYSNILRRLQAIKVSLDQETENMKIAGRVATDKQAGWMYLKLLEEMERIKDGSANLDGISAGPDSDDNIFVWNISIFGPDGTDWEGGIFNLEIVYSSNADIPPRIRFTTEMYHPHITKNGIPYYLNPIGRQNPVIPLLKKIKNLLKNAINPSPVTWLNTEAAEAFFSKDEKVRAEYRQKVKRCVRKSVDG